MGALINLSPQDVIRRWFEAPRGTRLYKPVSDWLKMLPLDITALNMYFLLDINGNERIDLCLNVKGNYMLFV